MAKDEYSAFIWVTTDIMKASLMQSRMLLVSRLLEVMKPRSYQDLDLGSFF